jgi:hypothetical protein
MQEKSDRTADLATAALAIFHIHSGYCVITPDQSREECAGTSSVFATIAISFTRSPGQPELSYVSTHLPVSRGRLSSESDIEIVA